MSPFLFWKNKNENSQGKPKQENIQTPAEKEFQQRKEVFTWVLVFGVLILGFSVWQTGHILKSPFEKKSTNSSSARNSTATTNEISAATLDSLKTKDTDNDGVSDYNELYVYQTSPYLSDSDGDGLNDRTEIDGNTDPNCPKDKTCSRQVLNTNSAAAASTNDLLTDGSDLTSEQLRSVLRDSGVSESELSQVDDATLMQWYQQALAEQEGTTNTNTSSSANTNQTTNGSQNANISNTNQSVTYDDLKNLSITDIRYLLQQSGVPADTLNQVDDATLKQIYLDSLSQNAQGTTGTNTNT